MSLLAHHPEVVSKIREEMRKAIGYDFKYILKDGEVWEQILAKP